jgi:hypothetical protein
MKTRNLLYIAWIAVTALVLAGCDHSGSDPYVEEIVLQGNMYVGHPMQVRVTRTIPIDQRYDSTAVGVSGATVRIQADGHEFTMLEETSNPLGGGFYSVPADSHIVTPGVTYDIRVEALGHVLTAQTRATGYLHDFRQNLDSVMYGAEPLVLRWTQDTLAFGYFLMIESLNPYFRDDSVQVSGNNGAQMADANFSFWNVPWREDSVAVPWIILSVRGRHRVRLFTCDKSFWDYSSTLQLSNANNDPISNVHGGLGIFAAGDVDTTYFELLKNPNIEHTKY